MSCSARAEGQTAIVIEEAEMRRKWIVIPALAALLLTGTIAGTAFAQSGSSEDSSPVSRFVEILADKLGLGEEELQTAVE